MKNHGNRSALLTWTVCVMVALALTGLSACTSEPEPEPEPEPNPIVAPDHDTVTLYIRTSTEPGKCTISDADDNPLPEVRPGDHVEWINETGNDVQLIFGNAKELFGVTNARVSATGGPFVLRVRDDAAQEEHGYMATGCGDFGGPGLIVCPPDGPC